MKHLSDKTKKEIIQDINLRIGNDIHNLEGTLDLESDLASQRKRLQDCLLRANDAVPSRLSSAIEKAESNSKDIENLKEKSAAMKEKVDNFLQKTEPIITELDKRFTAMAKLEEALAYLKSYTKIEDLCTQMKQCKDDEQLVVLYGEMKDMCTKYPLGHRGAYIKEYTHYWHDILKENITKHFEEHLKVLKWPLTSGAENSPLPKETLNKFTNLTRYLFLIQEPEDTNTIISADLSQDQNPCLPVRILLRPLKKRFAFHFTGSRQTARIDRPEWFLTQTLTWIKDHQGFVKNHVQPVADKLELKNVNTVNQFNSGLIALAAERLHTVLAAYHNQGAKSNAVDVDAAFAHAVDETLGFHRELVTVTGKEANNILSVLTRAETFVQWLAVERKYALAKMEEILDNEQWIEPVAAGVSCAVGAVQWVPRGADWFITLLKTIEDRYAMLPQPGHRLQFLELQLELIEEWRVRLTQLLGAAADALARDSLLAGGPHALTAVINAAHHTHNVLLQWAHSLHYLQLHYYRRQFQHFTQLQHKAGDTSSVASEELEVKEEPEIIEETMSLSEVEIQAKKLALNEVTRRTSSLVDKSQSDKWAVDRFIAEQMTNPDTVAEDDGGNEDHEGAFAEVCGLLAHLRNAGVARLVEHILLEFKATIRDYKRQKWHAMVTHEAAALSVSAPLCSPLAALCARLAAAAQALAPRLAGRTRSLLADQIDTLLYEEVVLENWFNTGGTLQLTHDVKRNLMPAFAPHNAYAQRIKIMPKLQEACKLLNLDYDDARRLRVSLSRAGGGTAGAGAAELVATLQLPHEDALRILNQRTDLGDSAPYVLDLF